MPPLTGGVTLSHRRTLFWLRCSYGLTVLCLQAPKRPRYLNLLGRALRIPPAAPHRLAMVFVGTNQNAVRFIFVCVYYCSTKVFGTAAPRVLGADTIAVIICYETNTSVGATLHGSHAPHGSHTPSALARLSPSSAPTQPQERDVASTWARPGTIGCPVPTPWVPRGWVRVIGHDMGRPLVTRGVTRQNARPKAKAHPAG